MRGGKGTMKGHKKRKRNCKGKKKAKRKGREGESKGWEGGGRRVRDTSVQPAPPASSNGSNNWSSKRKSEEVATNRG